MENPIARVCREKNINRTELAILSKCDRSLIANTENGSAKSMSPKILNALVELGYERDELAKQYESYRASLLDEIRAKLVTA